jgi:hypothetical protein
MVSTAPSQRNRQAAVRRQDKIIGWLWLPFSLLFHLWIYLTPTYEEKWGLLQSSRSELRPRPSVFHSFVVMTLVITSVVGFTLFVLMMLPPLASRLLLLAAFGFSFRQFLRPKA